VQKLSALLRIANALDRSHKQKIKNIEVRFNKAQDITLVVESKDNCLLEKADFVDKKELFEDVTGSKINLAFKN
jgi:exopolyphosphatase/guanosine-5'-triphosphate,3'-diphosphate pyrophosphatase